MKDAEPTARSRSVGSMFSSIARRYDCANRVLSLLQDVRWRRALSQKAAPRPGQHLLDLCTGTGDVALEFARRCPALQIMAMDFSAEMVAIAARKAHRAGRQEIALQQADVLALPYGDGRFDIVTIAFGLRNLTDPLRGLREMARVLKPGGQLLILEFSLPQGMVWGAVYRFYLASLLPFLGGWLSGEQRPYEYLRDSIHTFAAPAEILRWLRDVGLRHDTAHPLSGGIVTMYQARK